MWCADGGMRVLMAVSQVYADSGVCGGADGGLCGVLKVVCVVC